MLLNIAVNHFIFENKNVSLVSILKQYNIIYYLHVSRVDCKSFSFKILYIQHHYLVWRLKRQKVNFYHHYFTFFIYPSNIICFTKNYFFTIELCGALALPIFLVFKWFITLVYFSRTNLPSADRSLKVYYCRMGCSVAMLLSWLQFLKCLNPNSRVFL